MSVNYTARKGFIKPVIIHKPVPLRIEQFVRNFKLGQIERFESLRCENCIVYWHDQKILWKSKKKYYCQFTELPSTTCKRLFNAVFKLKLWQLNYELNLENHGVLKLNTIHKIKPVSY